VSRRGPAVLTAMLTAAAAGVLGALRLCTGAGLLLPRLQQQTVGWCDWQGWRGNSSGLLSRAAIGRFLHPCPFISCQQAAVGHWTRPLYNMHAAIVSPCTARTLSTPPLLQCQEGWGGRWTHCFCRGCLCWVVAA
jgi:hypothetical protein